jgi:hypothetical protein
MYYKEWFGNGGGAWRRRGVKLDTMKGEKKRGRERGKG